MICWPWRMAFMLISASNDCLSSSQQAGCGIGAQHDRFAGLKKGVAVLYHRRGQLGDRFPGFNLLPALIQRMPEKGKIKISPPAGGEFLLQRCRRGAVGPEAPEAAQRQSIWTQVFCYCIKGKGMMAHRMFVRCQIDIDIHALPAQRRGALPARPVDEDGGTGGRRGGGADRAAKPCAGRGL